MFGFISLTIIGLILLVVVPRIVKRYSATPDEFDQARYEELLRKFSGKDRFDLEEDEKEEYREYERLQELKQRSRRTDGLSPKAVKIISGFAYGLGIFFLILALGRTSIIIVPQDNSVHLKRIYFGNPMEPGQIIADKGQNGPQKRILPPGLHIELFVTIINETKEKEDIEVLSGHVLTLIALDGKDKPEGQLFADPWPDSLDKKRMLEDAEYALRYLQKGPQPTAFGPGKYRFNQYLYDFDISRETTKIRPGEVGLIKSNYGPHFDHSVLFDSTSTYFELFPENLVEGGRPIKEIALKAKLPPEEWKPSKGEPDFNFDWLDDPKSKWCNYYPETNNVITKEMVVEAKLVPQGYLGVWWDVLKEGEYALNPLALEVTPMQTKTQTFNYFGGFTINEEEGTVVFSTDQTPPADRADFATDAISNDGFSMAIDYRFQAKVLPKQAPYAFVMWGSWQDIEDKAITPDTRSAMRNNAQNVSCLDYFKNRALQEQTTLVQMWQQLLPKGITTVDMNYGKIHIPPDLRKTQTRKVLAEQNKLAWQQEKNEQVERILMEEKRATADQQQELVKAKIAKEQAEYYKKEQELKGQGDANYYRELADGQKELYYALSEVIGADAFAQLEMLKILKEMGVTDITPQVFTLTIGSGTDDLTSRTFGPLVGTILSDMLKGKVTLSLPTPADSTEKQAPNPAPQQP